MFTHFSACCTCSEFTSLSENKNKASTLCMSLQCKYYAVHVACASSYMYQLLLALRSTLRRLCNLHMPIILCTLFGHVLLAYFYYELISACDVSYCISSAPGCARFRVSKLSDRLLILRQRTVFLKEGSVPWAGWPALLFWHMPARKVL